MNSKGEYNHRNLKFKGVGSNTSSRRESKVSINKDMKIEEWPPILKKPPMYTIPAKKPKNKIFQTPLRNSNRFNIKKNITRAPNISNSTYLKGNPVTSVVLPYTLPNIYT